MANISVKKRNYQEIPLFKAISSPLEETFLFSYNLIPTQRPIYIAKIFFEVIPLLKAIADPFAYTYVFSYNLLLIYINIDV